MISVELDFAAWCNFKASMKKELFVCFYHFFDINMHVKICIYKSAYDTDKWNWGIIYYLKIL